MLEKKGYLVIVPELPRSDFPALNVWLATMQAVVKEYGEGIIVGHSLGGVLAAHYLLEGGSASKVILVGTPFTALDIIPTLDDFMIDFSSLKKLVKHEMKNTEFVVFQSTDDPYVPKSHGEKWAKLLGAKYCLTPHYGHFTAIEMPEILEHF